MNSLNLVFSIIVSLTLLLCVIAAEDLSKKLKEEEPNKESEGRSFIGLHESYPNHGGHGGIGYVPPPGQFYPLYTHGVVKPINPYYHQGRQERPYYYHEKPLNYYDSLHGKVEYGEPRYVVGDAGPHIFP